MKLTMLALLTFAQLTASSAVRADSVKPAPVALTEVDLGSDRRVQRVQDGGTDEKKLDINVTIGDAPSTGSNAWYAQPTSIAMFVGGLVLLTLLAMAFRGSGATGGTIVKG